MRKATIDLDLSRIQAAFGPTSRVTLVGPGDHLINETIVDKCHAHLLSGEPYLRIMQAVLGPSEMRKDQVSLVKLWSIGFEYFAYSAGKHLRADPHDRRKIGAGVESP